MDQQLYVMHFSYLGQVARDAAIEDGESSDGQENGAHEQAGLSHDATDLEDESIIDKSKI